MTSTYAEIDRGRAFTAITEAAGVDPAAFQGLMFALMNREIADFGSETYSTRMLAHRDATNAAFTAAGIHTDEIVLERAALAAYYATCGATSLAPMAAETIANAVREALAA